MVCSNEKNLSIREEAGAQSGRLCPADTTAAEGASWHVQKGEVSVSLRGGRRPR